MLDKIFQHKQQTKAEELFKGFEKPVYSLLINLILE